MKVENNQMTTNCFFNTSVGETGEIVCEEESYEVAYFRFTEGLLNTAVVVPVDKRGRRKSIAYTFDESSSATAWFVQTLSS